MRTTLALLIDAYRELNAKKLFWITMGISGLIVLVYAAAGIDEKGLTFLHWHIPAPITSNIIPPSLFYKFVFAKLGIPYWLTWGAMILALISTASIIPDFVLGGAVELTLSKPIGRVRLFLTKYACGLLFVGLQVAVFTTASFLVIGIRGGTWQPSVFLAIPIVLGVFSYIYCVSSLVGMLTRSTIASVLVAALFWFMVFILNSADNITLSLRKESERSVQRITGQVTRAEKTTRESMMAQRLETAKAAGSTDPVAEPTPAEMDAANAILANARSRLADNQKQLTTRTWWSNLFLYIKAPLPKTTETTGLLDRYLITQDDLGLLRRFDERNDVTEDDGIDEPPNANGERRNLTPEQRRAFRDELRRTEAAVEDVFRSRSLWWVLGTSLAFEAFVLGLSCWIFARKDF